MKRLSMVALTAIVLLTLYGCGSTAQTEQSPTAVAQEEEATQADDGASQGEATPEEELPAAPTEGDAVAVDTAPGMPMMVRLDDAVDLTKDQLITEGSSLAVGCTMVYYTELTFADARTAIERQFNVAGYTIDPTVVDEKGLYKISLSPPASAGVQTKRRIVNIKQETDAAGVAMFGDKVRVYMGCY